MGISVTAPTLPRPPVPYAFSRSRSAYNRPDPKRVQEQLTLLQNYWRDWGAAEFMSRFCWIQKKPHREGEDSLLPPELKLWNKNLVPFLINNIQQDIEKRLGQRNIVLKSRQIGKTTYFGIRRVFIPCILNPGENGLLISRNGSTASDCFIMLKRCLNHFGEVNPFDRAANAFAIQLKKHLLHTRLSNRRELVFDGIDVAIRCASAEDTEAGQGYTYSHVLADEVARWEHNPEETMANMKAAVPDEGTLDVVSTANGYGGYFFEECQRAMDVGKGYREFVFHFHTWNQHEEYTEPDAVDEKTLTKEELLFIGAQEKRGLTVNMHQMSWRRKNKERFRHEFDEKYPEDVVTCFLSTGGAFFDSEIIRYRYQEVLPLVPYETHSKLLIFKKERPHHRYIIGADVASGLEVGTGKLDWSVGEVIDLDTGEQCAEYRDQVLPEEFAWDLAALGRRYNDALIAVERNNEGGAVILTLERAESYGNLYKHIDWTMADYWRNTKAGQSSTDGQGSGQRREKLGWPTTEKTRPLALNRAKEYVQDFPQKVHSEGLLKEMSTFVRNQDKHGRPEAMPGCHDDRVLAYAISQIVRQILLGYLVPEHIRREKYGERPQEFKPDEEASTIKWEA